MAVIHEARALLIQFGQASLRDLYWRGRDWEVFMAREEGGINPMLAPAGVEPEPTARPGAPTPIPVTAPHLGIFDPRCAVGDMVERNGLIGVIDVLGRKTEIFSSHAGQVTAVRFAADELVEFGDHLFGIAVAV